MPEAYRGPVPPRRRPSRRSTSWIRRANDLRSDARRGASRFRRLFGYTRPYRGRLFVSWIATAGYAAAGALLAYMVRPIFDEVLIAKVNTASVAATILALYVVKGLCAYLSTTLVASVGQRAVTDLRNALYEHVLRQSFSFLGGAQHRLAHEPHHDRRRADPERRGRRGRRPR